MSNSSDEATRLSLIAYQVLSFGGLPIFICGLIGNFINIFAFTIRPEFNKIPTSIFLVTSFSGSFITLSTGLLPQLVYGFTGVDPLANYIILCKLRWFLGVGTATVAVHSLCYAAFNQCLITINSVRYQQLITQRRALILSLFIVIYCMASVSPNLFYYTHVINEINQTTCNVINPTVSTYNAYNTLIIYTLIPMFSLSLFSLLTLRNIRNMLVRRPALEQTVIVLIATVAYCIRKIYFLYQTAFENNSIRIARDEILTNGFTLCGFSIHGFTFFIYLAISKPFRTNIQYLIRKRQSRN
ncbi:unnamed protein product [Adineta steineri]|uniref:G-protein coupled receptors family 1 profile domain-containing protein n=1 Tax=Adineta steineri TaxID=433720 RepID=A0A815Q670_9BILA|nr:unnamed protein product [Adineta steineri]CAF3499215.1 unnamed protein product [Adineta steineri]